MQHGFGESMSHAAPCSACCPVLSRDLPTVPTREPAAGRSRLSTKKQALPDYYGRSAPTAVAVVCDRRRSIWFLLILGGHSPPLQQSCKPLSFPTHLCH